MRVLCLVLVCNSVHCVLLVDGEEESWLLYFVTVSVMWIFLTVLWFDLWCVIVFFPDHTQLLCTTEKIAILDQI